MGGLSGTSAARCDLKPLTDVSARLAHALNVDGLFIRHLPGEREAE